MAWNNWEGWGLEEGFWGGLGEGSIVVAIVFWVMISRMVWVRLEVVGAELGVGNGSGEFCGKHT